jgi:hypothetical protein
MKILIKKILNEQNTQKNNLIKLLDNLLNTELKKVQISCDNYEDGDSLPDYIAESTCYFINNIEKIKVYDIEEGSIIRNENVLNVHINVDIHSMRYFDVVDVLYDIKQRISKIFGQRILLIEGDVNNSYKGDW